MGWQGGRKLGWLEVWLVDWLVGQEDACGKGGFEGWWCDCEGGWSGGCGLGLTAGRSDGWLRGREGGCARSWPGDWLGGCQRACAKG